jgi:hypothetical protein
VITCRRAHPQGNETRPERFSNTFTPSHGLPGFIIKSGNQMLNLLNQSIVTATA